MMGGFDKALAQIESKGQRLPFAGDHRNGARLFVRAPISPPPDPTTSPAGTISVWC